MQLRSFTLKNGLTVYVDPKPIGEAGVLLGINAGYFHEEKTETAHCTEHIVAAPTAIYRDDRDPRLTYANRNASTSDIRTCYYFTGLLPQHLSPAIADLRKIFDPIDVSILEKQREAVRHELKGKSFERELFGLEVNRLLFPRYNARLKTYRERQERLDAVTGEDIQKFYDKFYSPKNSFIYLGGELSPGIEEEVANTFETVEHQKNEATEKVVFEPEPPLDMSLTLSRELREDENASVDLVYRVPQFGGDRLGELAAMVGLERYLAETTGPLYRILREERNLCYTCGTDYTSHMGSAGLFFLGAQTSASLVEKTRKGILDCLSEVAEKGIPPTYFEVMKYQEAIAKLRRQKSLRSGELIDWFNRGIDNNEMSDIFQGVSNDTIKAKARYLLESPHVTAISLPKKR